MGSVRRIFAEKKEAFAGQAHDLTHELRSYLGLKALERVRILIRYDIENLPQEVYLRARDTVFSEPPVDRLYEEEFPRKSGDRVFAVEYLPGQFDQRADSALQCLRLLDEDVRPLIRTATVYVLSGPVSEKEAAMIREYCCNPVDSRICSLDKPLTLELRFEEPEDVAVFEGFCTMDQEAFRALYDSLGLAMTMADFELIREYYRTGQMRDPTVTEIRVLDTYWSDHCRHTTFSTELKHIAIEEGRFRAPVEAALRELINKAWREIYYQLGRNEKDLLSDNEFLRAHWIMYYSYSRKRGDDYIKFLLRKFSHKSIFEDDLQAAAEEHVDYDAAAELDPDEYEDLEPAAEFPEPISGEFLQPKEIMDYVNSLNETAEYWYYTFYPDECTFLSDEEKVWLEKLKHVGMGYFRPMIAVSMIPRFPK